MTKQMLTKRKLGVTVIISDKDKVKEKMIN